MKNALSLFCIVLCTLQSIKFANAFSYTHKITEQELQKQLDDTDQVLLKHQLYQLTLHDLKIDLLSDSNQVNFATALKAEIPGFIQGTGNAEIIGEIAYNKERGEFYLNNAQLVAMTIHQLPNNFHTPLKQALQQALDQQFTSIPVYRLDDNDIKEKMTKATLQSVNIVNETVVLEFRPF